MNGSGEAASGGLVSERPQGQRERTVMTPPVLAPPRPATARPGALVAVVAVLAAVYAACSTRSIGRGFGGVDGADHWIDAAGRPTARPPLVAQVTGQPSPAVLAALLLGTVVALVLARRAATPAAANRVPPGTRTPSCSAVRASSSPG